MSNLLPEKAKFGSPCSGCGNCCATEICGIGREAFPDAEPPCPGLAYFDNRLWCKFVLTEKMAEIEPLLATALGIGKGCCADDLE
jgi:hypothetical protein